MKRYLAFLPLLLMSLSVTVQAEPVGDNKAAHTVEGKTYPYLLQIQKGEEPKEDEMTLYYVDGGDIPYVALSEYMPFLSGLFKTVGKGDITYEIELEKDDNNTAFRVTRPDNQSVLYIDPAQDLMIFDNFNTFIQAAGAKAMVAAIDLPEEDTVDVITLLQSIDTYLESGPEKPEQAEDTFDEETETEEITPEDSESEPSLFAVKYGEYVNRAGDAVMLNLSDYEIDIIASDDECYIPFQTMNDLLENETYVFYVFDGEKVLGSAYGCKLINEMDSAPKHDMSEEFALFNYNELRLLLDCKYGLKPEHGIDDFETFLNINTYLVSDLAGTDPMRASLSLIKLTSLYFDDLHSAFIRGSYMYERDPDIEDTVDLIIYANSRIKREGSPIRNIVLDLSNNDGGSASAAVFVMSWFLGEADIALRDVFTGAETNAMYLADVNLDGKYNGDDNVGTGYKLYCLTSNSSFSCGNLLPAACKSSGKVTLVGQTTGGGSCVVLPCTTAAGDVFQISGPMQMSIIRNGSFYNTDSGITPHVFLDKPESYYDRPALAEYLRELK